MKHRIILGAIAITAAALAGCGGDAQPTYPTNQLVGNDTGQSAVHSPMIPEGSVMAAHGEFSQIRFTVPTEPTMLYIQDEAMPDKVISTNAVTPGRTMSLTDLGNVVSGLDTSHKYKVFTKSMGTGMSPTAQ